VQAGAARTSSSLSRRRPSFAADRFEQARPFAGSAMSLRIAVVQHERETGPGTFAALLDEARVDYQVVETFCGRLPDHAAFDGAIALGGSLSAHDPPLLETPGGSATVY
jgi:hypothetical protein